MALWDKLKTELDRAGRAAQTAIDEGKVRLDVMRARQLADKAAETLGYAVFNARRGGGELDADSYARLSSTLAAHMAEVERLESQFARASESGAATSAGAGPADSRPEDTPASTPPPPGSAPMSSPPTSTPSDVEAASPPDHVDPAMGDDPDRSAGREF
ncbi:MAG: hypothetical protein ACYC2G_00155 [Gemmatimonadaceae bacterium]